VNYTVLNIEYLKLCTYILIDYDIQHPAFKEEIYPDIQALERLSRNRRKEILQLMFVAFNFMFLILFVFLMKRQP